MRQIQLLLIILLLSGQSIASAPSLSLDEKSKIALSKLSAEELCESTEDNNFKTPRNICTSWETNIRGTRVSCLEWGSKANKQNYINEFKKRKYAHNKCTLIKQEKEQKYKHTLHNELSEKTCESNPPSDTRGMQICSGIELTSSENVLIQINSDLSALLDRIIDNNKAPSPSAALSESQKSWEDYRENHCQIHYRLHYRGSLSGLAYTGCKIIITNKRIMELREIYNEWQNRGY